MVAYRIEDGSTPLHAAARWGTADVVTALLDAGADPNARTEDGGFTPLQHAAANKGSAEVVTAVVTALVRAGANPMTRNAVGAGRRGTSCKRTTH